MATDIEKNENALSDEALAEYISKRESNAFMAKKSGNVLFRAVKEGEKIPVFTKSGNLEAEEIGQAGKFLVTRCDDSGKPIVDEYGHTNSWQISAETFAKKYEIDNTTGIAIPKGEPQKFITTDRDITLYKPWGKDGALVEQNIPAGGVLNITNKNDVYGIAKEEFAETYKVLVNEKTVDNEKTADIKKFPKFSMKHSGNHSLKVKNDGKENVNEKSGRGDN